MLDKKSKRVFEEFYKAASSTEQLTERERIAASLAASMALGCYPCMEHYFKVAKKAGLSADDMGAVQAIVMAVSSGKVNGQVREVRKGLGME